MAHWRLKYAEFLTSIGNVKRNAPDDIKTAIYLDRFEEVHDGRYGYSRFKFTRTTVKEEIECYLHGFFERTPAEHLRGQGCPTCNKEGIDYAPFASMKEERFIVLLYNKLFKLMNRGKK